MADYQSILTVNVQHEYYNAYKDEPAPFALIPDRQTEALLKQYSMLLKSKSGSLQLIVDSEVFSDLADLTQECKLRFYLVSTDPVLRSITKMPNTFDIALINAEFVDNTALSIAADNWAEKNKMNESTEYDEIAIYDKNLISILNVHIAKKHFTLEKKRIALQFESVLTYWKYYLFSINSKKDLTIASADDEAFSFSEQDNEQIANKTVRIFLSDKEIPLRKAYTATFSLLNDKKTIVKSLPLPAPCNISAVLIDGEHHFTSHIYVS